MTNKRRKANALAGQQFYKLEKWLLAEKSLKKLSCTAKMLYTILLDREQLSLMNYKDFTDKEGCIYQYYDQEKASDLLGVSLTAIKKAFKDLQTFGLIESVRQGQGKPNRLYILEYEVSEDTLKELSYENKKSPSAGTERDNNKNDKPNNIIPQNSGNDTKKDEDLEIINLIKESCINVRKADLIKYKDEFADINKFKEAIAICESRNSHGIKALRLAYKYGDNDNKKDNKKQSTLFMADSQVDINGKLKSVNEMTNEEIELKIKQKWGLI